MDGGHRRRLAARGQTAVALWEPPLTGAARRAGCAGTAVGRRSRAADLVADLVADGVRTLAFVRSRHGAEILALQAQGALARRRPGPGSTGWRRTEAAICPRTAASSNSSSRCGDLLAVSATNALELGIDIAGLDAVVMAGFPGTRASMWQQIGRSGREGQGGLGILVARDDPLDTYLVTHPDVAARRAR